MLVDLSPLLDQSTEDQIIPYEDSDDPNRRTHIVSPPENPEFDGPGVTAQDVVDAARMLGAEVVALCGYKFVPVLDPKKYDSCEPCFKIAGFIMQNMGE